MCVCVLSRVRLCDHMACSPPGSSVVGFSRQESWSGLPFPSPGDLPDPERNLCLLRLLHWQAGSLPLRHLGGPIICLKLIQCHILIISLKLGMQCDGEKVSLYYYSTFFSTTILHSSSPNCLNSQALLVSP